MLHVNEPFNPVAHYKHMPKISRESHHIYSARGLVRGPLVFFAYKSGFTFSKKLHYSFQPWQAFDAGRGVVYDVL
jgi:hypothetical protein